MKDSVFGFGFQRYKLRVIIYKVRTSYTIHLIGMCCVYNVTASYSNIAFRRKYEYFFIKRRQMHLSWKRVRTRIY